VVWHHTTQRFNPEAAADWIQSIHFFGMRAEVGVSLFFVLSGCLLSLPFWNSFVNGEKFPSIRFYAINRAARIIPAFWFNLIFCTVIAFWFFDQSINWWRLISGLIFINSYHYSSFFPAELNGPLWSIGLEVSCYLLLPIVLFVIIKSTKKLSLAFAGLITWIAALQLLNPWIISNFMTSEDQKGWQYGLTGGAKQWLPYWNIDSFFSQFLCGSLAALIIVALTARGIKSSHAFDISAIAFAIAAIWLVANRLAPGAPDSFTKQPYIAPFYAILMAAVLVSAAMSRYLYKVLDNKLFRCIAKLSFSIYLWHMCIIVIIERKILDNYVYYGLSDALQWVFISSIVLLASIAIAATSWRFLESPILKSARKHTTNRV
jgi:peptidoglycan/LPS O-acetylase OafA/YrhL